ncbi:hypothetical protein P7M50_25480, partial [Vibrio parahaemolyticus]|nr:hypothetical protein [Vibrio parahaemolyticus]
GDRAVSAAMWTALPLLCAGAWLLSAGATAELTVNAIEKFHFTSWMKQHQKTYSSREYSHRLQVFANNWRKIQAHRTTGLQDGVYRAIEGEEAHGG